jgi:hypothetical protein
MNDETSNVSINKFLKRPRTVHSVAPRSRRPVAPPFLGPVRRISCLPRSPAHCHRQNHRALSCLRDGVAPPKRSAHAEHLATPNWLGASPGASAHHNHA